MIISHAHNDHDQNRATLIWLSGVAKVGAQTLKKMLVGLENLEIAIDEVATASAKLLKKIGFNESQISALREFQKEFSVVAYNEMLAEKQIQVVCWDEPHYPDLLREIPNYPVVLYYRGPSDFWRILPIAVVGTRHLTAYGEQATSAITRELVEAGATIISGFMYGADMEAHLTAMQQKGKSVGVLGYGFDYLPIQSDEYPSEVFLDTGNTFVTEYPPFVAANKGTFPVRNRIVAGMANATVVIEAAQKSGSLITAQAALDYGRTVCAVPGPFTSVYSEGTKNLINQGAKLVTSGYEIIAEIQPSLSEEMTTLQSQKNLKKKLPNFSDPLDQQIFELVRMQGTVAEDIAERLALGFSETLSRLSILEVNGAIRRLGDKWWSA